jgi:pyruvate/2-oxoglutarate dehydrogenase complex dihydrolipoamide acyltransferase (E2) component
MMRKTAVCVVACGACAVWACDAPKSGANTPPASVSTNANASAAPVASAGADASAGASAGASASAGADAGAGAGAGANADAASASAVASAPIPKVDVKNIGMHIGGGPNDAATKEPIAKSVEPHMDALRRCFALVDDPKRGGDFGVDLLIEPEGGKAKVTHPRTSMKGSGFEACVVKVFEGVDFLKPRTGKTMVSYSLRFTP